LLASKATSFLPEPASVPTEPLSLIGIPERTNAPSAFVSVVFPPRATVAPLTGSPFVSRTYPKICHLGPAASVVPFLQPISEPARRTAARATALKRFVFFKT